MNNLDDLQFEKILSIKKDYTLRLAGVFFMTTLITTLIVTRDFFDLLPKDYYVYPCNNPSMIVFFGLFIKYSIDMNFEIEQVIKNTSNEIND